MHTKETAQSMDGFSFEVMSPRPTTAFEVDGPVNPKNQHYKYLFKKCFHVKTSNENTTSVYIGFIVCVVIIICADMIIGNK